MCETDTYTLHQLNAPIDTLNTKNLQTTAIKIPSFPDQTTSKSYEYDIGDDLEDEAIPIPKQISWTDIPSPTPSPPPPPLSQQPLPSITSNTLSASTTSSPFGSLSYSVSLHTDNDDITGLDMDTSAAEQPIALGSSWQSSFRERQIVPIPDVPNVEPSYDSEPENNIDGDDDMKPMTIIDNKNDSEEDEEHDHITPNLYDNYSPVPPLKPYNVQVKSFKDEIIETRADGTSHDNDSHKDDYFANKSCVYEKGRFKPRLNKVDEQRAMLDIRDNIEHHVHSKLNKHASHYKPGRLYTEGQVIEMKIQTKRQVLRKKKENFQQMIKRRNINLLNGNKKKNKKPKAAKNRYSFLPNGPQRYYAIPLRFTKEALPKQMKNDINIDENSYYEFIIKMLGVIKPNYGDGDTHKVFDFGLNGRYFKAKRQDPSHPTNINSKFGKKQKLKPWIIDEIIEENDDIKEDEIVRPPQLLDAAEMDHIKSLMADKQRLIDIMNDTKWKKIPIYMKESKRKRMGFSLYPEDFKKNCEQFIENENLSDISLIPIVMFDYKDKYHVEYVWIVKIFYEEVGIDIGISYRLDGSKDSVYVVGIYINKNQILKQHHIISLKRNAILDNFTSIINYFHIGNPDDDKNRAKDAQKRYENVRNGLVEFEREFPE